MVPEDTYMRICAFQEPESESNLQIQELLAKIYEALTNRDSMDYLQSVSGKLELSCDRIVKILEPMRREMAQAKQREAESQAKNSGSALSFFGSLLSKSQPPANAADDLLKQQQAL